jgi:hypothetical protein
MLVRLSKLENVTFFSPTWVLFIFICSSFSFDPPASKLFLAVFYKLLLITVRVFFIAHPRDASIDRIYLIAYFLLIRYGLHRKRCYQNSSIFSCVFVAAVFKEPLPSNERGIHIQTHRMMGGIMKYAVEMDSVAMIYIPRFIKNGSGIQK